MKNFIIVFLVLLAIVLGWFFYPRLSCYVVGTGADVKTVEQSEVSDWELTGQHGDTYGGLTSFFTMLAFAGVVFTMWLQYCQLKEQRLSSAADRTPFLEWDPPVLHIVGRWCCDGDEFIGATIKTVVSSMTGQPVLNPVIGFEIKNSNGRVLARSSCDYRGGMFTEKRNLLFVSHLLLKCNGNTIDIIDALVSRSDISLCVKLWYMNNSGETFVIQRMYGIDCPSDESRNAIMKMKARASSHEPLSGEEVDSWKLFTKSLMELVIEDKDTFVQPFVSCVSKIALLRSGPIQFAEYATAVRQQESISKVNRISCLKSYGESFAVKTNRKLHNA